MIIHPFYVDMEAPGAHYPRHEKFITDLCGAMSRFSEAEDALHAFDPDRPDHGDDGTAGWQETRDRLTSQKDEAANALAAFREKEFRIMIRGDGFHAWGTTTRAALEALGISEDISSYSTHRAGSESRI